MTTGRINQNAADFKFAEQNGKASLAYRARAEPGPHNTIFRVHWQTRYCSVLAADDAVRRDGPVVRLTAEEARRIPPKTKSQLQSALDFTSPSGASHYPTTRALKTI